MRRRTLSAAALALGLIAITGQPGKAHAYHDTTCREYTKMVYIDGRFQAAYGTACLQPDGSWQAISPASRYSPPPRRVHREIVYVGRPPRTVYRERFVHHHMPPGHYKKHYRHKDRHKHHRYSHGRRHRD